MATAAASISELFESNKNCDVIFKVKCGRSWSSFPAHKIVLSIWSPVLANKFQIDSAFNDEIEILDIRPSTFQAFLSYLYGSRKKLEECENDVKFVLNLYKTASKYQVQRLKADCCDILNSSSPNKNNVFELIDAALLINSNSLKGQCFRVLQFETEAVLNSLDIESFTPSMVTALLQLPSLWLSSEYELLTWVFKWATSYCTRLQNGNNPRDIINPFLPYLNFTALKSKEFAILVSNHRGFFDEAECFNIFMNIDVPESTELPVWYSATTSSRQYTKPIENAESAILGDFAPEMSHSINNLTNSNSDISNYNVSSVASISSTTVEGTVPAVYTDTITTTIVDNDSVNCDATLVPSMVDQETMTDVAMDIRDKETMTDVAMDIRDQETMTDVAMDIRDQETMTDVVMDIRHETATLTNNNLSVPLEIETSNDTLAIIEMTERGQNNASVLETMDNDPGISWESLEPPLHIEKIKKKKVLKLYLLSEGKSMPNIGVWDPVLESPFKSGDIKSMSYIIEKQQSHPIADGITAKRLPKYGPSYIRFLSSEVKN